MSWYGFGAKKKQQTPEEVEERYKTKLYQLENLGYTDRRKNLQSLKIYDGNVNLVIYDYQVQTPLSKSPKKQDNAPKQEPPKQKSKLQTNAPKQEASNESSPSLPKSKTDIITRDTSKEPLQNETLKHKVSVLNTNCKKYEQDVSRLSSQLHSVRQELEQEQAKSATLIELNNTLKQQLETMKQENSQDENEALKHKVYVLNTKCKEYETENATIKQKQKQSEYENVIWKLKQTNNELIKQQKEESKQKPENDFKNDIFLLDKKMNAFGNVYNYNKLSIMYENDINCLNVKNELNGLEFTYKSFGKTLHEISGYIESITTPNIMKYETWNVNMIILWIKTLDDGKYIKYCDVLRDGFLNDGIENGESLLAMDDQKDLRNEPFGIKSLPDRKALIKHIQALPILKRDVIDSNNNNNDNDQEGAITSLV